MIMAAIQKNVSLVGEWEKRKEGEKKMKKNSMH